MLLSNLRQRLARDEGGFTLIELLVVLIIIAVLLAIAIPSYLQFRDRAEKRSAAANVRSAIPAAEAYYADKGTYANMTVDALKASDAGLKITTVTVLDGGAKYCISSTSNGNATNATANPGKFPHEFRGPGGDVVEGSCTTTTTTP